MFETNDAIAFRCDRTAVLSVACSTGCVYLYTLSSELSASLLAQVQTDKSRVAAKTIVRRLLRIYKLIA